MPTYLLWQFEVWQEGGPWISLLIWEKYKFLNASVSHLLFFPQHSLSFACCPIYLLQNHHATHSSYHTAQKYFQFNPNNLNKWKRELVPLLHCWVKKKKKKRPVRCVSVQQLRTVIHADRGRELNLQRKHSLTHFGAINTFFPGNFEGCSI